MTDRFYVELAPVKRGPAVVGARAVRMTRGMPALAPGNVAVRVALDVPPEAFEPLSVALVVEPSRAILAASHEALA